MCSLVRPALGPAGFTSRCNFSETFGYNTNKTFPVFIDLFTFFNLIQGFPDVSEALENQVNANVGEVCFVICLFYGALNYLDIFWIH